VVIGKWLMTAPRIMLLNDPTRGIDVGTKQELYQLMRKLADEGAAILFYSTDYAELIGCCDRVLVVYDGRSCAELVGRGAHRARAGRQRAEHLQEAPDQRADGPEP
jgi:ribose transport system ATP-binding protein